MKKLFLSFSALFFGITMTQAQFVIKPAAGVNFTDLSKDAAGTEVKAKVGWQIGGTVVLGEKNFYLEPGIFYVQKSSKFDSTGSSAEDLDFNISGIRIPVSIGYTLGDSKSSVKARIFGGGSAFILTNTKSINKDDLKNAQWGVFAGAGLDISMFFLDASYEWSLTDISDDVNTIDVGKTRTIFVQAGIRIEL
ncbi:MULTISPECIES: porin family protein [Niastella]|uniref:PorT family protein n=1 Tax=Niastella soli TaxID=2821487 RepID=A0ABS3YZ59_9BACT|nr:porin family protein [Niastella soli]MBO9203023.1 PorT family protein [Niastella soli]